MASGKGSKKKRPAGRRPPGPPAKRAATPGATPAGGDGAGAAPPPPPAAPASGGARPGRDPSRKPTRTERLDAARRARRRKALLVRWGVVAGIAVLVGGIVLAVLADRRADKTEQDRLTTGSCDYDTKADRLTANFHVAPSSYDVDPPAGGDHDPTPAAPGIYGGEGPPAPPDARLVHSLEHGIVVLWHRPDLPEAELQTVRDVFDEHSGDVIVVPRASLDGKVAATSWGRRLLCGEVERNSLSEFVELYRNDSPEPNVR